jgi:hypothetical protein
VVSDRPPETRTAAETFLVRQTFTCSYPTDALIIYRARISYEQETVVTDVKSGNELRRRDDSGGQSVEVTTKFKCLPPGTTPAPTATSQPLRQIASTFDGSLEGWSARSGGCQAMEHRSGGGNPGGFLFVDNDDRKVPEKFRAARDLSAFYGGTISFDGRMFDAVDPTWDSRHRGVEGFNYGTIVISGHAGTIKIDIVVVPREPKPQEAPWTQWQTHSASIVAGAQSGGGVAAVWTDYGGNAPVTEAQIRAVLQAVTSIDLNVEAIYGREAQGIDNFIMTAP